MDDIIQKVPPFNIPIPDPSTITAQEITKAKNELRREFEILLQGLRDTLNATREGYIRLFEARSEGIVHRFDEKANALKAKIDGINDRLSERDRRFDAIIHSQKEATVTENRNTAAALAKTEASFTKEIDSLKALISATKDSLHATIGNLTGRLDRGEAGYQGARLQTEENRATTTVTTLIISGVVGFLVLLVMIIGLWISSHASRAELTPLTLHDPRNEQSVQSR